MKNLIRQLKQDLRINKEGIIGGAIVGVVVATYIKWSGAPLNLYEASQGWLFDRAVSLAPQTQELCILYITSILIFASVGYVIDRIYKPKR